ncbi:MAG: MFS transporter [Ectothiorhodospiraceae bacterium]
MTAARADQSLARRVWGVAAIAFIGGVGGGVVFPILPVIGMDLGISGFMIGLILSANRITRLGFNPVTGSLLDRFGARWPVAAGLTLESLGTLAFSAALSSGTPSWWFLGGRVIWGMGSSLLLVGTLAAVMSAAPVWQRGGMTARVRSAISLGLPAGLVIGGLVADGASANAAFMVATVLSLGGAVAAVFVLPGRAARSRDSTGDRNGSRAAQWGELFRIPALGAIWSANALLFFAVSGVLLASLAVMVKQREIYVPGLGAEGSAGLYMAMMMVARASASLAVGRHLDRVTSRTGLLLPAQLMVAAGFVALGLADSVTATALALLLVGAGSGGMTVPLLTLLGDLAPRHLHGRALSVYQWSSDFGGALGPAVGLEFGHALGFGATYIGVGIVVVCLTLPLRAAMRRRRVPRASPGN